MAVKDKKLPREQMLENLKLMKHLAYINDNGADSILIQKEALDLVIFKTENGCGVTD